MQQSLPDVWRDLLLLHLVKAECVLWSRSWKKNPQPNVIIFLYEIRNVLWNVLLCLGCMFEFELEQILLTLHFLIIIKYYLLTVQMQWHFSSSKISSVSFTGHGTKRLASMTHHFHLCLWKEYRKRLLLVVQTDEKGFDQFLAFLVVSKLLELLRNFFIYKSVSVNHDTLVSSVY